MDGIDPEIIKAALPEFVILGVIEEGVGDERVGGELREAGQKDFLWHFLGVEVERVGPFLGKGSKEL